MQQFSDTEVWRNETQIEKLFDTIDVEDYEETKSLVSIALQLRLQSKTKTKQPSRV